MATRSIDRILDLIEIIAEHGKVDVDSLSRLTSIPRPTVYRMVRHLERRGYLSRGYENRSAGAGLISLGYRFIELGEVARQQHPLSQILLPVMREVLREVGETVHLLVRVGAEAVLLERVDSPHSVRVSYSFGHRIPLYRGASPKVILANLSESERAELYAMWEESGASAYPGTEKLKAEIRSIQEAGYAVTQEEVFAHVAAVAVPVPRPWSREAALSINLPLSRFRRDMVPDLVRVLNQSLERVLGKTAVDTSPKDRGFQPLHGGDQRV